MTEAYSEHCQTSKMESFAKIVNGFQFDKVILTRLWICLYMKPLNY